MKRFPKILTLIVFSSLLLHLSAQEGGFENDPIVKSNEEDRKFRFGLHFSPNLSWLNPNVNAYSGDGLKLGFAYGFSTEFFIAKNYLFSTGFNLSSLGGKLSYEGVYTDNTNTNIPTEINQTYTLKYIDIPLVLKMRTNEIGYLTYYGKFGVNAGFNYGAEGDFDYKDVNGGISADNEDIGSSVSFINMGLVVGAGMEYNVSGNTNVMIGVTFNNGFINQLDGKVHELDANGKAVLDGNGDPVYSDKDANAILNYFALDLAVYF